MAEAAGLALGVAGLAGLVTSSIECFEYVQLGRNLGKDYGGALARLDVVQLRISRWAVATGILTDPERPDVQYKGPVATAQELNTIKRVLGEVLTEFNDAHVLSQSYASKESSADLVLGHPTDLSLDMLSLHDATRAMAARRQKKTSVVQKAKWGLYGKKRCDTLIANVADLVDQLITLFPAKERQTQICKRDVAEIESQTAGTGGFALLKDVAKGVDPMLEQVVHLRRTGHSYEDILTEGDARVKMGDEGTGSGSQHSYKTVVSRGNARVLMGNSYDGKSIFDD